MRPAAVILAFLALLGQLAAASRPEGDTRAWSREGGSSLSSITNDRTQGGQQKDTAGAPEGWAVGPSELFNYPEGSAAHRRSLLPRRKPPPRALENKRKKKLPPPAQSAVAAFESAGSPPPLDVLTGGDCPDIQNTLTTSNELRARHGAPPLVWNTSLAEQGQAWSETLVAEGCGFRKPVPLLLGINLYHAYGDVLGVNGTCTNGVLSWYSEVAKYNFDTPTPFDDNWPNIIGHFTQLVWKSSQNVGCGIASGIFDNTPGGVPCYMVTCYYDPPGNYAYNSDFAANVLPLV